MLEVWWLIYCRCCEQVLLSPLIPPPPFSLLHWRAGCDSYGAHNATSSRMYYFEEANPRARLVAFVALGETFLY